MMAKKNNKTNNSKKNKNAGKKIVDEKQLLKAKEDLLKKQQQIEINVLKIIDQLRKDFKSNFINFKKKKEIKNLIAEFQMLLDSKEYDILSSKMSSLEMLYEKEKKDISDFDSDKNTKSQKKKFNLLEFLKTARYPIFTRYKNIITQETGSDRIKKLCMVSSIILVLISVSIVGFLMYFSVIPGISVSSTETDNIFSIFVFAIPLGLLFII